MGSLLCRHAPPLSEAGSLPAPGDEPICPGFEYPAYLLLLKGSPEAPLPLLPWGTEKRPGGRSSAGGSTAVCDCPFPGSGPGHGCPCMEDMEEHIGHTYRRVSGCVLRCVRRCEHCGKLIFCLFHKWLMCTECKLQVHQKCEPLVRRECAAVTALREPKFQLLICPERGLGAQDNRCAECRTRILPAQRRSARGSLYWDRSEEVRGFRRCDYSGLYYCLVCIRGHLRHIPARVIRNWDWTLRLVSVGAMRYLKYMHEAPVINLESINPQIFSHAEELGQIRELRRDLHVMWRDFLRHCDAAHRAGLLRALGERPHLVDQPHMYSMQDLEQARSKRLVRLLLTASEPRRAHIRVHCQTCRSRGRPCAVCGEGLPLFPFDRFVSSCSRCGSCLHVHCLKLRRAGAGAIAGVEGGCPDCAAAAAAEAAEAVIQRRLTTVEETSEEQGEGEEEEGEEQRPPSAARPVPTGGARQRRDVSVSSTSVSASSVSVSAVPRTLPRTPMSDAWSRALEKDRRRAAAATLSPGSSGSGGSICRHAAAATPGSSGSGSTNSVRRNVRRDDSQP